MVDPDLRATSASLVKELIPFVDCYIGIIRKPETHRTDSMLVMQTVNPPIDRPQAPAHQQTVASLRKPRGSEQSPSYEGNGYAILSSELRLRETD